ncbi:MAG: PfkB family carbohydrate kinase [Anaerolineae bacterium]|nr:PfkB family carbohydrate kinase [Anaerolineae bacterium]
MIDYLLIGHLTADLHAQARVAGGTVAYAARTAWAFGLRVGVVTSAKSDEPLLAALTPYAEVIVIPSDHTTTFENRYTPTGREQMIHAIATRITPDAIPQKWRSAPLVHLAPIADEVDLGCAGLFADSRVTATLQGWLRRWDATGRVGFKRFEDTHRLRSLDLGVLSAEDIRQAPELRQVLIDQVRCLCITEAEQGGVYYQEGRSSRYAALPVTVVDPTGAGDIFATSLFAAFRRTNDFAQSAQIAAQLAAISVTRVGLDSAPTPIEVAACF